MLVDKRGARGTILGITPVQLLCFLAFWGLNLLVILRGINCIKWLESWAAPFLLLMGLALLGWALVKVPSVGELFTGRSAAATPGVPLDGSGPAREVAA